MNFADKNTSFSHSDKNADDGFAYTALVGSFPANDLGLRDMAGNVWEWCSDWYDAKYYANSKNSIDPQGPATGSSRVVRGGSWYVADGYCRATNRSGVNPGGSNDGIGFRVVLPAQ